MHAGAGCGCVTATVVGGGCVTARVVGRGCVTATVVGRGCITARVVGRGCVTATVVGRGCVTATVAGSGCVTATVVCGGCITATGAVEHVGREMVMGMEEGPGRTEGCGGLNSFSIINSWFFCIACRVSVSRRIAAGSAGSV